MPAERCCRCVLSAGRTLLQVCSQCRQNVAAGVFSAPAERCCRCVLSAGRALLQVCCAQRCCRCVLNAGRTLLQVCSQCRQNVATGVFSMPAECCCRCARLAEGWWRCGVPAVVTGSGDGGVLGVGPSPGRPFTFHPAGRGAARSTLRLWAPRPFTAHSTTHLTVTQFTVQGRPCRLSPP